MGNTIDGRSHNLFLSVISAYGKGLLQVYVKISQKAPKKGVTTPSDDLAWIEVVSWIYAVKQ